MKKKNGTYHIQTFEQYLRSSHHHSSMEPQKTTRFSNYSWKLIEKPPRAQYVKYIKRLTVRTNIFNLVLCCCRFQRKKKLARKFVYFPCSYLFDVCFCAFSHSDDDDEKRSFVLRRAYKIEWDILDFERQFTWNIYNIFASFVKKFVCSTTSTTSSIYTMFKFNRTILLKVKKCALHTLSHRKKHITSKLPAAKLFLPKAYLNFYWIGMACEVPYTLVVNRIQTLQTLIT